MPTTSTFDNNAAAAAAATPAVAASAAVARLRGLLKLDAATCALMGVLLLAAGGWLASWTGLDAVVLTVAGGLLLPVAAFMAWTAGRSMMPAWALAVIVLGNLGWVAASLLLPVAGLLHPNGLGWAFLLGQAAVVLVLVGLEVRAANLSRR